MAHDDDVFSWTFDVFCDGSLFFFSYYRSFLLVILTSMAVSPGFGVPFHSFMRCACVIMFFGGFFYIIGLCVVETNAGQ